jgi:spore germination protein YaaH
MKITIARSKGKTTDGFYVYNFENIPQGYIKVCNLFLRNDNEALTRAKKMAGDNEYEVIEGEE